MRQNEDQAAQAAEVPVSDKISDGAKIIIEWLGDGGEPVPIAIAQRRADICLGCPENAKKTMWSWLSAPVARTVLTWIARKNEWKLTVEGEEDLGTCKICLCHMPTKVWTPIMHIKNHTDERMLNKLPDHCWVKNEIKS